MATKACQTCAGCGCEMLSGVHWTDSSSQTVRLCCNKRCINRAQRRYNALRAGANQVRLPKISVLSSRELIEPEASWGSLSSDVLCQISPHLEARDLLSAALSCRHWQGHLTGGVTHLVLRVDDVTGDTSNSGNDHDNGTSSGSSGRRGRSPVTEAREGGAGVVLSARSLLPQVRTLALTVASRSYSSSLLLNHLRALSSWTHLKHVQITWDILQTPFVAPPSQPLSGAVSSTPTGNVRGRRRGRARTPERAQKPVSWPDCTQDTTLCSMGLGVLGLLTGLESLSITAHYDWERSLGLFGLSSLERLTALELLQAGNLRGYLMVGFPWSTRDADLAALPRLVSLRISGQMMSPALLGGLTRLTHLVLEDMPLSSYQGFYDDEINAFSRMDCLMDELVKLRALRMLEVQVGDPEDVNTEDFSWGIEQLAAGIKKLTEVQMRVPQELHEQPQQPGGPRRRNRRHGGASGGSGRGAAGGGGGLSAVAAGDDMTSAVAFTTSCPEPLHVKLGFNRMRGTKRVNIFDRIRLRYSVHAAAEAAAAAAAEAAAAAAAEAAASSADGGVAVDHSDYSPLVVLNRSMLLELSGVIGLRRLDLRFESGQAELICLSQLTNLTHLGLRCLVQCFPVLEPRDLRHLTSSLPYLRNLILELPASSLTATALLSFGSMAGLKRLELRASPHALRVTFDRWQVRAQLRRLAELAAAAEDNDNGGVGPSGPHGNGGLRGLLASVDDALPRVMFLQQLYLSMPLCDVRGTLRREAEWRLQQQEEQMVQLQQQTRELQEQMVQIQRQTRQLQQRMRILQRPRMQQPDQMVEKQQQMQLIDQQMQLLHQQEQLLRQMQRVHQQHQQLQQQAQQLQIEQQQMQEHQQILQEQQQQLQEQQDQMQEQQQILQEQQERMQDEQEQMQEQQQRMQEQQQQMQQHMQHQGNGEQQQVHADDAERRQQDMMRSVLPVLRHLTTQVRQLQRQQQQVLGGQQGQVEQETGRHRVEQLRTWPAEWLRQYRLIRRRVQRVRAMIAQLPPPTPQPRQEIGEMQQLREGIEIVFTTLLRLLQPILQALGIDLRDISGKLDEEHPGDNKAQRQRQLGPQKEVDEERQQEQGTQQVLEREGERQEAGLGNGTVEEAVYSTTTPAPTAPGAVTGNRAMIDLLVATDAPRGSTAAAVPNIVADSFRDDNGDDDASGDNDDDDSEEEEEQEEVEGGAPVAAPVEATAAALTEQSVSRIFEGAAALLEACASLMLGGTPEAAAIAAAAARVVDDIHADSPTADVPVAGAAPTAEAPTADIVPTADTNPAAEAPLVDYAPLPSLPSWILRDYGDLAQARAAANSIADASRNGGHNNNNEDDDHHHRESTADSAAASGTVMEVVYLHKLSLAQLARLRSLLFGTELCVGPSFRLSSWVPLKLEVLRLEGFFGLDCSCLWAGNSRGREGMASAMVAPYLPYLRELDVVATDEAAAAAMRRAVEEWSAPGLGCAPRLERTTVTVSAEGASAVRVNVWEDDEQE